MDDLLPVALGAGIALVASWGSEWLRYWFTRKHEREEQRLAFQRDTLMRLHGSLTEAIRIGNRLHHMRSAENDWDSGHESDDEEAMREHLLDVSSLRAFVDDEAVRNLVLSGLIEGSNLYSAKSKVDSEAQRTALTKTFHTAIDRIGDLAREAEPQGRLPKAANKPAPRAVRGAAGVPSKPTRERR
jgi:hypothetical protein